MSKGENQSDKIAAFFNKESNKSVSIEIALFSHLQDLFPCRLGVDISLAILDFNVKWFTGYTINKVHKISPSAVQRYIPKLKHLGFLEYRKFEKGKIIKHEYRLNRTNNLSYAKALIEFVDMYNNVPNKTSEIEKISRIVLGNRDVIEVVGDYFKAKEEINRIVLRNRDVIEVFKKYDPKRVISHSQDIVRVNRQDLKEKPQYLNWLWKEEDS